MNENVVKKLWVFFTICLVLLGVKFGYSLQDYSIKYSKEINAARNLLTDEYSKEAYDALVAYYDEGKAIDAKLKDKYPECFNPQVSPKEGDVIINGGISDDLSLTYKMADAIGPKGEIHGFDPNMTIVEKIKKQIADKGYTNVKTHAVGLWNKNTSKALYFKDNIDGSLVYRANDSVYIPATLVKLDDYAIKQNIPKIDLIVLDIEGAEKSALKGAENILKTQKPDLAISIHHRPQDVFEIINDVNKLGLGYKFQVGAHSAPRNANNVIMYATVK